MRCILQQCRDRIFCDCQGAYTKEQEGRLCVFVRNAEQTTAMTRGSANIAAGSWTQMMI